MAYVIGIDPSASSTGDWFAFVVTEARIQTPIFGGMLRRALDGEIVHRAIHAERHRGMALFDVPDLIRKKVREFEARDLEKGRRPQNVGVVYDATGYGRALYEVFQEDRPEVDFLYALTLTAGENEGINDVGICVPKRELVFRTMRVAGAGRLTIPRELKLHGEMEKEFRNLQTKVRSGGGESIEGAGTKSDDLALALCYCTWLGERIGDGQPTGSVEAVWA